MVTTFTKENLKVIDAEINAALQAVATKHGITLRASGGTYSGAEFTTKIKGSVKDTQALNAANANALRVLGLPADTIGKSFSNLGKSFTISDVNLSLYKRPIVAKCANDGKEYIFTPEIIKRLIA